MTKSALEVLPAMDVPQKYHTWGKSSSPTATTLQKKGSIKSFFRLFEHKPKPQPIFRVIEDEQGKTRTFIGPYELTNKILGHGGNSVVNLGIDTRTPEHKLVAIKSINVSPSKIRALRSGENLEEVKVMRKLLAPGVCQLHDVFLTESYIYLIMEFVEGQELFEVVKAEKALSEEKALALFSQIVTSLSYLHSVGMVHNDLKLENILVSKHNEVTLIDFGHASSGETPDFSPGIPTLDYVAPEVILYNTTSTASDIWSLGVVFFIMLAGHFPFTGTQEELRKKIVGSQPKFPKDLSPDCRDLLEKMLAKDPKERITLEEIKRHPWFLQGLSHYSFGSANTLASQ